MKRVATEKEIEVFNDHLKDMNYSLHTKAYFVDGLLKTEITLLVEEEDKEEDTKKQFLWYNLGMRTGRPTEYKKESVWVDDGSSEEQKCCAYPNPTKASTFFFIRCVGYFVLGLVLMLPIITIPIGLILFMVSINYSIKAIKNINKMVCKNCKKIL